MDFAFLPPEISSGRMYDGPGSGPMLAAAAAWDGLAAELHSAAASYASVISGLTAGPWLGRWEVAPGRLGWWTLCWVSPGRRRRQRCWLLAAAGLPGGFG